MAFEPRLPDDSFNVSKTHPLAELALLLGGLMAAMVLLVAGVALALDWIVPRLPVGLEQRLFAPGWLAGLDAGEADASDERDPRQVWVQGLVDRLAAHWPENPYALRTVVIDSPEPNALAFPGGWIAVTSALIEGAQSENEVAFVLGHELGHFRDRDHLRGLGRGLTLSLVGAALGRSGAGAAAELATLAGLMAERGFSREQERDADRFGLELLMAEYGHVAGATDFFARLSDPDDGAGDRIESFLSTHPLHGERIAALREEARARGYPLSGELTPLPELPRPD